MQASPLARRKSEGGGLPVLSHPPASLGSSGGGEVAVCRMVDEYPHLHTRVQLEALLYKPTLGERMRGTVAGVSAGFVTLLVGGLFNASIASEHLAAGGWSHVEEDSAWQRVGAEAPAPAAAAREGRSGKRRGAPATAPPPPSPAWPHTIAIGCELPFRVLSIAHCYGVVAVTGGPP
jgi:hypothetical protein